MLRGEEESCSVRAAHACLFLDLAETAAYHLRGPDQVRWFDHLETEHDNLRASMAYLLAKQSDAERPLRMGVALRDLWLFRGHFNEGIEALEPAINRLGAGDLPALRASALLVDAALHYVQGRVSPSRALIEEGLAIARQIGVPALTADALAALSWLERDQGDLAVAVKLADEAVGVASTSGDTRVVAEAYLQRANALTAAGQHGARNDFELALSHFRADGNRLGVAQTLSAYSLLELKRGNLPASRIRIDEALRIVGELQADGMGTFHDPLLDLLTFLGLIEILEGKPSAALRAFSDVLRIASRIGIHTLVVYAVVGIGFCASRSGDFDRAAMLQGSADLMCEQLEVRLDVGLQSLRELDRDSLRQAMGADAYDSAYLAGRNLARHDAIVLAAQQDANE